jgi:hypothetical protein
MSWFLIYLLGIVIYALTIPRTYYKYCKLSCESEKEVKSMLLLLASVIWPISILFFMIIFPIECCELKIVDIVNLIIGIPKKED